VEQECAGRVRGAVQIVAKAAFFFSSGSYQGAQLRFENRFLAFARSQQDNQRGQQSLGSFALARGRERVLRELFFFLERLEALSSLCVWP